MKHIIRFTAALARMIEANPEKFDSAIVEHIALYTEGYINRTYGETMADCISKEVN